MLRFRDDCCSCSTQRGALGKIWASGCECVQGCPQERSQWCCFSFDNPDEGQGQLFVMGLLEKLTASYLCMQTCASLLASSNRDEMSTDYTSNTRRISPPLVLNMMKLKCFFLSPHNSLCGCLHWETPKLPGIWSAKGVLLYKQENHPNCKLIFNVASVNVWGSLCSTICAPISQTPFSASSAWCRDFQCCTVLLGSVHYQRQ